MYRIPIEKIYDELPSFHNPFEENNMLSSIYYYVKEENYDDFISAQVKQLKLLLDTYREKDIP